jgi:AcrR family transcriptional regulator
LTRSTLVSAAVERHHARMTNAASRPPEHVHLLRALASLALDYLRWTQLVPMLLAWTCLLLVVAALLLTNFQDASFSVIERGVQVYERWIGPIESTEADASSDRQDPAMAEPDGALRFTDEDIFPVVLRAWALLALIGWLFGVLRTMLIGPREPTPLARKLRIAAYSAAGCSGLMWISYALGSSTFHGSATGWAVLFIGGPVLVWAISAWSLWIGQLVCRLQTRLHA